MDKCHYYLSNGLWKIVREYFDYEKKEEYDYFWGMAVLPNYNSFGSHIVSTPWQQSWATMDILEAAQESMDEKEIKDEGLGASEINILRREVNFQYILRNCSSQPFVQQLFTTYSRMQTHLLINFTEAETKSFVVKLKSLLQLLINESPSSAHSLMRQMYRHGFFFASCLEALLNEIDGDNDASSLSSLLLHCLCQCDAIDVHMPFALGLSRAAPFRYELFLLLLAGDNIPILLSVIEEDKKLYESESRLRFNNFLEKGLEPLKSFTSMVTMGRHFLFQKLDMIKHHMDVFQESNHQNIPPFMWPLLLLQCWNDDSISVNVLPLLIDKCKEYSRDRIILQIAFILEWYLNFSKWYEKHGAGDEDKKIESKRDILQKAKDYSVLYLINNSTDLSETDWNQILELLKQGKSRADIVKSWDIILFDGYRILIHVLHIILASTEIYNLAKMQKARLSEISTLNDVFASLYFDEVTGKLKLVKHMIKTMYPLNFRLEILENIFSMIFVQSEDVKRLGFAGKVANNVSKLLQSKMKSTEKSSATLKIGKSLNVHYFHSTEKTTTGVSAAAVATAAVVTTTEDEDAPKRIKSKGFICKKYIIRDLIYLVKECLVKLEEDFKSSQSDGIHLNVPCSITMDEMENRLDRLSESVNEATWRLQLVSDPDFVSQIGHMNYACGQDPFHHFDSEWIFLSHDNDSKVSSFKSWKKSAEKANESGSQSHSSAGNGNSGGESQTTKHKISSRAIMNQMLSSDSSLVIQCLAQGDVLNANHIIQTLSVEENRQTLEGELQFTESINDLKKKLQNISLESPVKKYGSEGGVAKSYSLQSIQMVANQGVTSTALTNHIERFLLVSTLPSIQGASKVSVGSMLQCIENAQAIVTIDLALTTDMTFQDFKGLLNIASKHCPELSTRVQSPISPQTSFSKPLGYIIFSQNLIALLQEVNKSQTLSSTLSEGEVEVSLNQFLRSHRYPFSLKSLKDSISFWKQLSLTVSDFEKCDSDNAAMVSNKEVAVAKYQKNIKEMQKVFENLKKLVESCSEFMDLGKTDNSSGEIQKSVNYSDLLSRYLTDLASFILENIPPKSDLLEPVSYRSLLEQSAVDIVDRLIFKYNVEPTALEKKAQQLGFNLSASLVAGCCPRLPQNHFSSESAKCPPAERIVLNELVPDYKSTDQVNPAEVVESTFSELVIAFQNYSRNKLGESDASDPSRNILTEADILELRNDFKVQRILEKTLQLNYISLDTLKSGDMLPFFTNLLNLMMCHCYLSTKLDPSDGVYSNGFPYRDIGYIFLGYNVGELGFLSIYDVRCRIIGEEIRSPFTVRPCDGWIKLNSLSDPKTVFAISDFRSTSPRLRFYARGKMETQLEDAIRSYVEYFVCLRDREIVITDLLEWYLDRVLLNEEPESHGQGDRNVVAAKVKLLMEFLNDHSSNEFRQQLNEIPSSDVCLKVQTPSTELSLILEYDGFNNYTDEATHEEPPEKWKNRSLSDSIMRHLSQSSRVLADIVQKIHEAKEPAQTEEKLKYLDLLLTAPWFYHLSPLFDNNLVITALSKCPSEARLNHFFRDCILRGDWFRCLDVLFALPDYYMLSNLNLKRLRDVVLREITLSSSQRSESHPWYYSQHIGDINIRLETVKSCSKYWSGFVCIAQLSSILCDYPDLRPDLLEEVRCLIRKVRVYNTITETVPEYAGKSWFDVYSSIGVTPHVVLHNLIKASQLELCLQWINLPGILTSIQQYIDSDFVLQFFSLLQNDFELIDKLLNSLPPSTLSTVCDSVIYRLNSIPHISHLSQLLIRINPLPKYEVVAFGVRILRDLRPEEQSELVHLVSHPLLIIEQLLMNMRLDALENVLRKVRSETDRKLVNQTEVNDLIASYASKAVEFDFVKSVKNSGVRQSFLLEARPQSQPEFTVPSEVPDKSQWVPNNQVSLCMCCLMVSFSMFNRRHHCRRCGRVVCSSCSPHQLKVSGYRGVAVRVCHTCYNHHTKSEGDSKCTSSMEATTFNGSTFAQEIRYWRLSVDPTQNAAIRDEFSFEYIPNVSLCLAIFNLLPDATYSSVLLDESEKMLRMLQLNGKAGNPELDCGVVIQIIRSLIIGAKVKYGQASLTTGVACCDRLLSQVDLLHLLIKNHCSRLIPSEPLNGHTLRFLRDKLVEEELWELAIEVSTKCGLDRNGVWAAWGKVCLTAGSWEEARQKFAYCLDSSSKSGRNPPLVDEICRILESANSFVGFKQGGKTVDKSGTAQEVTQVLSNLKWIAQGKQFSFSAVSTKNSVQYNEQIYYLSTYGSHQGLLSFYLKYDEWKPALMYFLEQQLDADVFVEAILMPSFKNEQQSRMKVEMFNIDPSLESFKKYLCHSCVYLQKNDYLHILYEVQLLMQDYVRAAATCIRLYQRNSSSYSELVTRATYLHTAVRHLEEEMSALSKKVKRLDCIMKLEPREVNKHMNTIWRQLEVAKFLGGCEADGKLIRNFFPEFVATKGNEMATLFDGSVERVVLASLIILSGKNVAEGFGIAYRIIQDYQMDQRDVYVTAGKKLAEMKRLSDIESLLDCMKTSGADGISLTMNQVLGASLPLLVSRSESAQDLEKLVNRITNVDLKISTLIDLKQLKSAYVLAVRHNRLKEVQRILEVADQTGQVAIKKICMMKLGQSPDGSICSSITSSDDT